MLNEYEATMTKDWNDMEPKTVPCPACGEPMSDTGCTHAGVTVYPDPPLGDRNLADILEISRQANEAWRKFYDTRKPFG